MIDAKRRTQIGDVKTHLWAMKSSVGMAKLTLRELEELLEDDGYCLAEQNLTGLSRLCEKIRVLLNRATAMSQKEIQALIEMEAQMENDERIGKIAKLYVAARKLAEEDKDFATFWRHNVEMFETSKYGCEQAVWLNWHKKKCAPEITIYHGKRRVQCELWSAIDWPELGVEGDHSMVGLHYSKDGFISFKAFVGEQATTFIREQDDLSLIHI